jgi:hypothetical protein
MSSKEKPLPEPPHTPFGRKRKFEGEEKEPPLMADRMAMAMSEGKLDEFLQKEIPDNEHARKLAEMMMGMTGMMPAKGFPGKPTRAKDESPEKPDPVQSEERSSDDQPPEDVVRAVKSGDVSALVEMLQREHEKRSPGAGTETAREGKKGKKDDSSSASSASLEKAVIKQMMKIASENNISLDWIFFRALKRYVEEYNKTGNL